MSDAEHALFVLQEYRKAPAENGALKAQNPAASDVLVTTSLQESDAQRIADKLLAENVNPRIFPTEIEGLMWLNWWIGGAPEWMAVFPHDALAKNMKGISTQVDFATGTSSIEVRG